MYAFFIVLLFVPLTFAYIPLDVRMDNKAKLNHELETLNILIYTLLLILTVLTTWLFRRKRVRFIHETGVAVIYGLVAGALIKYVGDARTHYTYVRVQPITNHTHDDAKLLIQPIDEPKSIIGNGSEAKTLNGSIWDMPPDSLWIPLVVEDRKNNLTSKKEYVYTFRGELVNGAQSAGSNYISAKATFDPEIFFNIILPPIILNAAYSMQRRHFFRNLDAFLMYALLGTTLSSLGTAGILHILIRPLSDLQFSLTDCMHFGALISATDPVTVLAIFGELNVHSDLHSLVLGESILNDAVAMVLAGSIERFSEVASKTNASRTLLTDHERLMLVFWTGLDVIWLLSSSLSLGILVALVIALSTKFSRIGDHPLLECSLILLSSYACFLGAEILQLSGIVALLSCGICQAHYTAHNLSKESREQCLHLLNLLSFLAENFLFTYLGVSLFTYPANKWNIFFLAAAGAAVLMGRALNIYPLSFVLNKLCGRKPKIPMKFQHILFACGLRGAMAYALAIRNTFTEARQLMLTTTSVLVIISVITSGAYTPLLIEHLKIKCGEEIQPTRKRCQDCEQKSQNENNGSVNLSNMDLPVLAGSSVDLQEQTKREERVLINWWLRIDRSFLRPLFTNDQPALVDTMPSSLHFFARWFTTEKQLAGRNSTTWEGVQSLYQSDRGDKVSLNEEASEARCDVCFCKLYSESITELEDNSKTVKPGAYAILTP